MTTLALVAQLRNAVLEWPSNDSKILYFESRAETDQSLLVHSPNVQPFSLRSFLRSLRDPKLDVIELAEPMWITEWPRHYLAAVLARLICGKRVTISTYAIENLDWRARFSHPLLDKWPTTSHGLALLLRCIADATSSRILDLVVFGTPGAQANYKVSLPRLFEKVAHLEMLDDLALCACVIRPGGPRIEDSPVVQFLGENAHRKGVDTLLEAWSLVQRSERGASSWRLRISGPGFEHAGSFAGVEFESAVPRDDVYQRLAQADVIVAPSRRTARWREQKGLSIIEGLRHGAQVVTTSETGLAALIGTRTDVRLVAPDDPESLARAIVEACGLIGEKRASDRAHRHVDSTREQLWKKMRSYERA